VCPEGSVSQYPPVEATAKWPVEDSFSAYCLRTRSGLLDFPW